MAKIIRNVSNLVAKVDLEGLADGLILDTNGDTTISAPTDDQIDFEMGGSDLVVWAAATPPKYTFAHTPVYSLTPVTDATAGNVTYTIAQLLDGLILRDPNGGARSDVTPTAALMVAGVTNAAVNDCFEFLLINTANGAETVTLTAGNGVTLVPATVAADQNQALRCVARFTNVTSSSEAVTIYCFMSAGT